MPYLQYKFSKLSEAQQELLIALLTDAGCYAFEESGKSLLAFATAEDIDEQKLSAASAMLSADYEKTEIEPQNWNAVWEADFEPVRISGKDGEPFVYIRADFHPADQAFAHDILITPKMSFGTGHHPTTFLMVQAMQAVDFVGKTVIDFGTGTGVLAILAKQFGAVHVTAIDNDVWSVTNSKENLQVNDSANVEIIQGDQIPAGEHAEVLLANINLNILLANMSGMRRAVLPGGTIILSGVLHSDEDTICAALVAEGFVVNKVSLKDDWLSVTASKPA